MKTITPKEEIIKKLTVYELNGRIAYDTERKKDLMQLSLGELNKEWRTEKLTAWRNKTTEVVKDLLYNKQRGEATEILVDHLKEFYIFKTTRSDIASEIWIYKEGIYLPEGKTHIEEECRIILGKQHTSHLIKNAVDKIMADSYIDQDIFFEQQNKHPYLIPVKNGLLNLKNSKVQEYTSEIAFFNKLNIKFDLNAQCPNIKQFLKEITANKEDIAAIQELFGYCLIKEYKFEKAFMFYGSHGRNGKSKLLELLKRMLGVENVAGLSLQDIEKDQFCLSELHNKLVNISAEISKEAVNNTGNFKSITGRDPLHVARKFKTRLKFVNYAKMIFAGNNLPQINDSDSDAFWMRWVLIEFPHQFLPKKEIINNPDAKIQDPMIIDKITTIEELEGLLVWSIEGLNRLESNKDFTYKHTAKEVKLDWMKKSNSVAAFIYDFIEEDYEGSVHKQDFKKEYLNYCKKNRLKVSSDKAIKITLEKEMMATTTIEQHNLDGQYKKLYYWSGITWKKIQRTLP